MTTTIRTDSPRELLALIPYQLGFRPTDSLVVVSIRAERSQVGLVARMDIPDLADPVRGGAAGRALVGHLLADGARRAIVVLYTDDDVQAGCGGPASRALDAVQEAAVARLGTVDAWVVGASGYYAVGCTDRECCPVGGRPLADLQATRVGAQMVLEGIPVAASRADLGWTGGVDAGARKAARRARARWQARALEASAAGRMHRWRGEGLSLWRDLMADADRAWADAVADTTDDSVVATAALRGRCPWEAPGAASAGRLGAALDDVLVRDAALLTCVPGAERVADRVVAGDRGPEVGAALGAIVDPVQGVRPDARRVAAARAVLEHVAAHASRPGHAPALTLLALLAWWEGDGARAGVLVERALVAEPGHRMAGLLDGALAAGMPPGWVGRPSA